jgi:tyrosine-specific transport protein
MNPSEKPGSILGGILLIGGSCIGAGMLGLPILTGLAGFFPSVMMFIVAWAFMTLTGLLLVEVNGWFSHQVNMITMAGHTLGRIGRALGWILYLFLFDALLVAYISGSGNLSSTFVNSSFSLSMPSWIGSLFFTLLFGMIVYLGTRPVDLWNRFLMVGKVATYLFLVFLGLKMIDGRLLLRSQPSSAFFSLPILVISFGYHNMIPTLTAYMKGDLKRVRWTIVGGGLFALAIYLIWEILVLGIVPLEGSNGILSSLKRDQEASQALSGILGVSWVATLAQALAFFAILTSFLAQSLSLVHFLADGLKVAHHKKENFPICLLALGPPLALSLAYPQLFFKALNFAGGICAVVLFGVLPVLMVWIGRYRRAIVTPYRVQGGKPLLVAVLLFSLLIFFFQISSMLGASYLPTP